MVKKIFSIFLLIFSIQSQADLSAMKARLPKIIELKNKGVIGERADGLLGLIKEDSDARRLVEEENRDRLSEYRRRASEQGHKLETFQRVIGQRKIEIEPAGRYVQDENGQWRRK